MSATDSILSGIQKIDGNVGLKAPLASPTFTGSVSMPGTGIWNSSGYVGVGTASPISNLDVRGKQSIYVGNNSTLGSSVGFFKSAMMVGRELWVIFIRSGFTTVVHRCPHLLLDRL